MPVVKPEGGENLTLGNRSSKSRLWRARLGRMCDRSGSPYHQRSSGDAVTEAEFGGCMSAHHLLVTAALFALLLLGADAPNIPHPKIDQAALDKLDLKLGCQAWTFRKLSLFETLDTLNQLDLH